MRTWVTAALFFSLCPFPSMAASFSVTVSLARTWSTESSRVHRAKARAARFMKRAASAADQTAKTAEETAAEAAKAAGEAAVEAAKALKTAGELIAGQE